MNESFKEEKQIKNKIEQGIFDINFKGEIVLKNKLSNFDILEDEIEYEESEEKKKAISDLKKTWNSPSIDKILKDITGWLSFPDSFENYISEVKTREGLEGVVLKMKNSKELLEIARDDFLNHRIDLGKKPDFNSLNFELESYLDQKIKKIDFYLKRIERFIENIESKITAQLL